MQKQKILFVCLGNICRSPLAEALFLYHAEEAGLGDRFEADSCGTSGHHAGDLPDPRTRANAARNGIEILHRGRQLRPGDFSKFDLILTMDRQNYRDARNLALRHGFEQADIRMMRRYDPLASHPEEEVPDPWYGGEEGFEEVFQILSRSCSGLLESLRQEMHMPS